MSGSNDKNVGEIDVGYVANLARLALSEREIELFQSQLGDVMEHVQKIRGLDLTGIEPTSHAHPVSNVFRKDEVRESLPRDVVLKNAPVPSDGQFLLPKIIE